MVGLGLTLWQLAPEPALLPTPQASVRERTLSLHTGKCKSTRENAGAAVSLLSRGPEEEAETRSLSLTFRPTTTA